MTTIQEMGIMINALNIECEWQPRHSGLNLEASNVRDMQFVQDRHRCLVDLNPESERQGLFIEEETSGKSCYSHTVLARSLGMRVPVGGQCGKAIGKWEIGFISNETQLPNKMTEEQFVEAAAKGVYLLVHRNS